jgi:phosphoribosylamine-glycine ligase
MKIALNSYAGYGAWLAKMLEMDGHTVHYHLSLPKFAPILDGIVPRARIKEHDGRNSNANIGYPDYSKYDLSVFDLTGRERQADFSQMGTPTIGDGTVNKMLEEDRLFGIQLMEDSGVTVPEYEAFSDVGAAKAYIRQTKKRLVYKPNGGQEAEAASTYVSKSDEDMLEYIDKLFESSKGSPFILQEYIKGIEISVEGWFNGSEFYCLNATLEEKKFMNDNIGPNTGCAGNLVFLVSPETRVVREGIAKTRDALATAGYIGMIDLNTIATEDKLYGLEWTPRFGYDSSATLWNMYGGDFGDLLHRIASRNIPEEKWKAEYGAAARITVPPYPTEYRSPHLKGIPIKGLNPESDDDLRSTYLYDVMQNGNGLCCAGINGFIAAPVTTANDPVLAFDRLETRLKKFRIPDMQYRTDLKSSILRRLYELKRMGWV